MSDGSPASSPAGGKSSTEKAWPRLLTKRWIPPATAAAPSGERTGPAFAAPVTEVADRARGRAFNREEAQDGQSEARASRTGGTGMARPHSQRGSRQRLNSASEEELAELPMVGAERAKQLVSNRPFDSWAEWSGFRALRRHDRRPEERGRSRLTRKRLSATGTNRCSAISRVFLGSIASNSSSRTITYSPFPSCWERSLCSGLTQDCPIPASHSRPLRSSWGVSMVVTAFPVLARILSDCGISRTEGHTIPGIAEPMDWLARR